MTSNPFIGIGLRHPHYKGVFEEKPNVDWFEVHSENFFQNSTQTYKFLQNLSQDYAISLHGVGLSLGSADLCKQHLTRLKNLTEAVSPFLVSEHLSWNNLNNMALPDLFPLPYTQESFEIFVKNIDITQNYLNREILIENPSSYIEYSDSELSEVDFLISLCQKTGAKILLDINNIYVSSMNHGWDPKVYLRAIPKSLVKEIHLAGHSQKQIDETQILLVDTHDSFICDPVWELYQLAIAQFGFVPTLIEWDANIPPLNVLVNEAHKALKYSCKEQTLYVEA